MSSPAPTQPLSPSGGEGTPQREIAIFVAAVRAQLNDLTVDEITELTGGLEADLTDALAEEGATPAQRYGDPAEYARELRTAAGLPPRSSRELEAEARRRRLHRLLFGPAWMSEAPARGYREAVRSLEEKPWWPAVREFLLVLRPVWWVLRAWVAVQVLCWSWGQHGLLAGGPLGVLALIAAVVGSVELGRRRERLTAWQANLVVIGNVLAAVLVLPLVLNTSTVRTVYESYGDQGSSSSGLNIGGQPIQNIYPYDSSGRLLSGVQLYDDTGRPLEVSQDVREYSDTTDDGSGDTNVLVPGSGQGTPPRWNVFPMQHRVETYNDNGDTTYGPPVTGPAPFVAVPPLLAPVTPDPSASAGPSASPGAGASPGASADPGASPAVSGAVTPSASAVPSAGPTAKPTATPTAKPKVKK